MLTVKNIRKNFGGVQAVEDCTFTIEPNKITALIGPNGAGKTSVFNLISGNIRPDQGRIIFKGRDITKLPIHSRARLGISRTFQMVRTFSNMSLEENLRLAAEPRDQDFWRALFLPHTVAPSPSLPQGEGGLPAQAGRRPGEGARKSLEAMLKLVGLDQPLNYPAKDLSYGQSRLLSLARALLMPHKILMLDEPVAGVAPALREQFKKLLPELKAQGETIFLIEHDMDFVRAVADTVIVMDQGRIIIQGTPEEASKDPRVLNAYLGEQL